MTANPARAHWFPPNVTDGADRVASDEFAWLARDVFRGDVRCPIIPKSLSTASSEANYGACSIPATT
jgi:hypothetical protein